MNESTHFPLQEVQEVTDMALSAVNLQFSYPGQPLLLKLEHLEVPKGKIVSILGPSGCGKTTLMLLIAGLLKPTAGNIFIFGNHPREINKKGSMAVVFQSPTLLPWRNVTRNLTLPFDLLGLTVEQEKIKNALDLVGLSGLENAHIDELSGGMQSRVAIARALVTEPSLLLMDEPFGNLDESNRLKLNLAIVNIQKKLGMTVFFITHNINEAIMISDRILVMKKTDAEGAQTEICADIEIDFPNKTLDSISTQHFQKKYQSILHHFYQDIKI